MASVPPEVAGALKTVERSITALEFVAGASTPPSVRDVAAAIGHNVSSTYNIVNTLIGLGYLAKSPNGALRIGSRVGVLCAALAREDDPLRALRPFVERVHAETGETVYLTRWAGDRVVITIVAEGTHSLRVTGLTVGFHGAEDLRASGKAVLAFLPEAEVRKVLRRNYPAEQDKNLARRHRMLAPELEGVRRDSFAFDDEHFERGICCVAAPYFDATGAVAGSFAVSAPATRADRLRGPILEQVVDAAAEMSRALGSPSNGSSLVQGGDARS